MTEENLEVVKRKDSKDLDNLIYQGELIFDNYNKDESIKQGLLGSGYTDEKMAEGLALLNELKDMVSNRNGKFSEQIGSTAKLNKACDVVYREHMKDLGFAKIAFKDNSDVWKLLGLDRRRKTSFARIISQMTEFYSNLLKTDVLAGMAEFGFTQEIVDAKIAKINELRALDHVQELKKGFSQDATKQKQAVQNSYVDWLRRVKAVIKLTFGKTNQLVEALGIKV